LDLEDRENNRAVEDPETTGPASDSAADTSTGSLFPSDDALPKVATHTGAGSSARYTIGEVVSSLREEFPSLSVSKVRYLERRRLIELERTDGGYRLFTQQDIDLLRTILTLQENEYLPLEVIKQRIDSGIILQSTPSNENGISSSENRVDNVGAFWKVESYSKEGLCESLEADPRFIEELISVGVIGRSEGGTQVSLDSRDVEIARMAIQMSRYGIQPRHLRGIVASVEREVAMFKQVLNPELRSGDEEKISKAMESARYLASVDTRLKELIISGSVESLDQR
jgi:DNA-binding transcriptional MerR regulator